uniref:Uncharacterized protein n=1 Tax=Meloidogyne enterolobii TaxID=390850 RepID=A0A6V7TRY8_MELEN|nr:unnamed protein product [Meloidogyne enterolobii]
MCFRHEDLIRILKGILLNSACSMGARNISIFSSFQGGRETSYTFPGSLPINKEKMSKREFSEEQTDYYYYTDYYTLHL